MHRVLYWVPLKYFTDPFMIGHAFPGWTSGEIGRDKCVKQRGVRKIKHCEFFSQSALGRLESGARVMRNQIDDLGRPSFFSKEARTIKRMEPSVPDPR
jgi:hypothetical protein